jgi:orotate phosphoribosyltransferase
MNTELLPHQVEFIDFLLASNVLQFGDFTTKSGRKSPYFLNFGMLSTGAQIGQIGDMFAQTIVTTFGPKDCVIYGPAYKGIPLAITTAIGLDRLHVNADYCFNRKEAKGHGDKGILVGKIPTPTSFLILVDDVITAGSTFRESVPLLRSAAGISLSAAVIGVDRQERGSGTMSARQEYEELLGIPIVPVVSISQILSYLSSPNSSGRALSAEEQKACDAYLELYGAR